MFSLHFRQYGINNRYGNALDYYDKLIDLLSKKQRKINSKKDDVTFKDSLFNHKLLIEIYTDKALIEQNRENFDVSTQILKEAIHIAEMK
jgi:hypothetical protein